MLPIAHAGHWFFWILYAVPVIVVLASIVTSMRRERREAAAEVDSAPPQAENRPADEDPLVAPEGER